METQSQDIAFVVVALVSGLFALLLAWRCYHFSTLALECPRLSEVEGPVHQLETRRNWYGASELDFTVGARPFRIFSGPWLYSVAYAAAQGATIEVRACQSPKRARVWSVHQGPHELLGVAEQLAIARDDAKSTGVMAFLFSVVCALFTSTRRRAA